jgi:hypothetical protein
MNKDFLNDGYCIVDGVFSLQEVDKMRNISLEYFNNSGGFRDNTGRAKPDWINDNNLSILKQIVYSKNLETLIRDLIGESVNFVGHNDLHVNRNVNWHKDRLNGAARKYEVNNPWSELNGQVMKIYKVNIYLQDHSNNNDGLMIKKGSHKFENLEKGETVILKPKIGSIVVFDQRITHRAQWSGGYNRLLICMGYGVKNCFFDEFQKGTEYRQDKQNERN